MKRPYLSQKCHVLPKLKMARSGQEWQRLKKPLIHPSTKILSRGSPRQAFGVTELGSPIISTSRSLTSIANMVPACQESELTQGRSVPASFSLPSLVPPFASPSSSFPSPDPSWCFYFFLFFSSSIEGGLPLNMVATGQSLERLRSRVQKDFWLFVVVVVFCISLFKPFIVRCNTSLY